MLFWWEAPPLFDNMKHHLTSHGDEFCICGVNCSCSSCTDGCLSIWCSARPTSLDRKVLQTPSRLQPHTLKHLPHVPLSQKGTRDRNRPGPCLWHRHTVIHTPTQTGDERKCRWTQTSISVHKHLQTTHSPMNSCIQFSSHERSCQKTTHTHCTPNAPFEATNL